MRIYGKIAAVLLAFLLVTAFAAPAVCAQASDPGSIRILFTHDMHASLEPAKAADKNGNLSEVGGFARLYTAIKEARADDADSTLLVDAGDYTMGTLFQTVECTQSPELRLMGMMGYDAVTVGNHEFDYTIEGFAKSLNAAAQSGETLPAYVTSNIALPKGEPKADALREAMQNYGVKEYTVVEKRGCRIGIFGVLGEEAANLAPMSAPAVFEDVQETAERLVRVLKEQEKVDLIVCLSHSGTNEDSSKSEDEQLAKAVPGIDVIISGHTHTILDQPVAAGNTIIASCGADSAYLGSLDIALEGGVWSVQNYALRPIDASITNDEALAGKVMVFKGLTDEYLADYGYTGDEVITNSPYQFENINTMFLTPGDYALGDITADSFLYTVKQAEGESYENVDVTVVPVGTIRATIHKGDVTVSDAFKILSLGTGPDGLTGYPLISVYLYGWELQNLCEVDASVAGLMGDAQLYFSGLRATYNPNRLIFNKVTDVKLLHGNKTQEIESEKLYRVVCSLYSGQMLGYVKEKSFGILSLTPKDKNGEAVTDFNKQIIYTQDGSEIKEWQAVVSYLSSFAEQDGISGGSTIPEAYAAPQGRKVADTSGGIWGILSHFNGFAWIALGVVIFLIAVLVLVPLLIVRGVKKRKARRAAMAAAA